MASSVWLYPVLPTGSVDVIASGTDTISMDVAASSALTSYYYVSGDNDNRFHDADLLVFLRERISELNTQSLTFDVELLTPNASSHGEWQLQITERGGTQFTIDFSSANGEIYGFASASYTSNASGVLVSPNAPKGIWDPGTLPVSDTYDQTDVHSTMAVAYDGTTGTYGHAVTTRTRDIFYRYLDRAKVLRDYADSDAQYNTLEELWRAALAGGQDDALPTRAILRYYSDRANLATRTYGRYLLRTFTRPWRRMGFETLHRYECDLPLREQLYPLERSSNAIFQNTQSVDFDGSSQYAETEIPTLNGNSAISLMFWTKPDTSASAQTLFEAASSFKVERPSATTIKYTVGSGNATIAVGGDAAPDGSWTHVACVFDGTLSTANRYKIYINGGRESVTIGGTAASDIGTPTSNLIWAKDQSGATQYFDGRLDEVAVWTRALTPREVWHCYNDGVSLDYNETIAGAPDYYYRSGYADNRVQLRGFPDYIFNAGVAPNALTIQDRTATSAGDEP